MKINVLQKDIRLGKRASARQCAIARASTRAGLYCVDVSYEPPILRFRDRYGKKHARLLPPEAVAFIERFDRGETVKPFAFQLQI